MKKVVGGILLISCMSSIFGMQTDKEEESDTQIIITKELVAQFKQQKFNDFIDTKKTQYNALSAVTNIPIVGGIATWGLKNIGGVDTEEAKQFLGRIFENEDEFKEIVLKLESNDDNLIYLKAIFSQLDDQIITSKSESGLVNAMRGSRHPKVPYPKNMHKKNAQNEYTLPNEHFLNMAACNLWAMNWLEQQPSSPRHRRKKKF